MLIFNNFTSEYKVCILNLIFNTIKILYNLNNSIIISKYSPELINIYNIFYLKICIIFCDNNINNNYTIQESEIYYNYGHYMHLNCIY